MTNFDLSQKVFSFLKQAQVQTLVVCAGARNAPLVMALTETSFEVIQFFEERSAAFYALGLMKATDRPVAILTTSGTAVAELLPAAVEATYQGLPLILVTADRPKTYRGSGAPQSIEQIKIFSDYVESVFDLDVHTKDFNFEWSFQKPIQLNICFDEPLLDKASAPDKAAQSGADVRLLSKKKVLSSSEPLSVMKAPLAILGELTREQAWQVKKILIEKKILVYAEALSHLVNDPDLQKQLLKSSDVFIKNSFQNKKFQSVIRIGGVPTVRFWRDLESAFLSVPVYHFTDRAFTGLARASQIFPLSALAELQVEPHSAAQKIWQQDQQLQTQKLELLAKHPLSESACVAHFSMQVGFEALYLGNSLPIRHWDSFAFNQASYLYGNRGANGIDGQISTYLGWSQTQAQSFCLIGDLTALYDLASLGLTPQLKSNKRRVVVLNNFGGQIFQRVLKNKIFINEHRIQFQNWAQMWGWDYLLVTSVEDFQKISSENSSNLVIEIQPNAQQTTLFWNEWDILCQKM